MTIAYSILLLCPDVITEKMAGPAIRYWEFAKALSPQNKVTLAAPNVIPDTLQENMQAHLAQHTLENIDELIHKHDILIFQGYIFDNYPQIRESNKILIADMYDPIPLEGLEQYRAGEGDMPSLAHQVKMMNDQLCSADYFLCASERQRDLWLGHLLALGRINTLTYTQIQQRVLTVPFGLPDTPPQHNGTGLRAQLDDKAGFILLWGGGIWEWFDPLTLIRAVHRLLPRYPDLRLVFLGTQHPNPTIPAMPMQSRAEKLAQDLGIYNKQIIFRKGWVPYDGLADYLLDADVGVSAHFDTLETRFSFRTRILHYLWAGKPVLTTQGDVLADAVTEMQAGIVLNPKDEVAWVTAIEELHDPTRYASYLTGVKQLAQRYCWSAVTYPLKKLCIDATLSPDTVLENGARKSLNWDCEQAYNALKCQLNIMEQSNSWKVTAPLRTVRRWLTK